MTIKKKIAILGSTGSIGTQALEIARTQKDKIEVEVLTANTNADLLIVQAKEFNPNHVVIADTSKYLQVKEALASEDIKVFAGNNSIAEIMEITSADTVLTAMVGYSGLLPTIKAIENKKRIALANKETLVVAGELITKLCSTHQVNIIPVDSEHSAIFQCLVGEDLNTIEKIILTASGGPFRGKKLDALANVTKAQALKHPNWSMGAKITIDSATLMNKGLEVIEAKWLFGVKDKQIEVVIHPQSIIHSMVEFTDGSIKAQMGLPDMKLPIHYAFFYPERIKTDFTRMNFKNYSTLTFEEPDMQTFRNLKLAYEAMNKGGNMACILNAANEIAVDAFLKDKINFLGIMKLNEKCMQKVSFIAKPTLEDYIETDIETRKIAKDLIG
ncbi:MAG: 1-deoxy-D-xylulose-5-phosphate reductoisomerase [Bacteroidia bacterium]|nr:1-deoxy-D-xylulose-5-phosphate reductoisomerase [Bacteroidia bacterium]